MANLNLFIPLAVGGVAFAVYCSRNKTPGSGKIGTIKRELDVMLADGGQFARQIDANVFWHTPPMHEIKRFPNNFPAQNVGQYALHTGVPFAQNRNIF